jgi:hypothetical protein
VSIKLLAGLTINIRKLVARFIIRAIVEAQSFIIARIDVGFFYGIIADLTL